VIDSKRSRVQRLIDMFEHQADSYILCHRSLEHAQISSLNNYSEFDNIDILDDSESQVPTPESSPAFHDISPPLTALVLMGQMLKIYLSFFHHLLDGNGA
jgi:hypothetical protein